MVLPLSNTPKNYNDPNRPFNAKRSSDDGSVSWLRVTSAVTLVTGGALLLAGKHRLGLVSMRFGYQAAASLCHCIC